MTKSVAELEQELLKLEGDRESWAGLEESYNHFVSDSITVKIFGGRNGGSTGGITGGEPAKSQGLSNYKLALEAEFFCNGKKANCEDNMAKQKEKIEDLIEKKEKELQKARAEQ